FKVCFNAASLINKTEIIPCTGCDYCADCPKKVKISTIFAIYNNVKNEEMTPEEAQAAYDNIDINASECVKCNKCKQHCPQGIEIPELLEKLKNDFFA
ncbi:MAG: 4Fe-4S dicluster domain-containing protein, partial [Eubacterium sp.]|nr:4Fe-4S dicluster domain-containing protein [Eubacterium sp.]